MLAYFVILPAFTGDYTGYSNLDSYGLIQVHESCWLMNAIAIRQLHYLNLRCIQGAWHSTVVRLKK